MSTVPGIDVSNNQGSFPWAPERGKIRFAFAKATEGITFIDPFFAANWAGMKSIGIVRGAYCFAHPADDPVAEANAFLSVVRGQGLARGDMLALDLEVDDGQATSTVASFARTWCQRVKAATGITPIVYTFISFAQAGNCAGLGSYPLWIADPSSPVGQPAVPPPWANWTFHQYASNPIDVDVFNGTQAQLAAFAGLSSQEDHVVSGLILNGANAVTPIRLYANGPFTQILFGADEGQQHKPPARLRVAVLDGSTYITEIDVSWEKPGSMSFRNPPGTRAVSVERLDAGDVNVSFVVV